MPLQFDNVRLQQDGGELLRIGHAHLAEPRRRTHQPVQLAELVRRRRRTVVAKQPLGDSIFLVEVEIAGRRRRRYHSQRNNGRRMFRSGSGTGTGTAATTATGAATADADAEALDGRETRLTEARLEEVRRRRDGSLTTGRGRRR